MSNDPRSPEEWDQRYGESERIWSGAPNGALVTEVESLPVGRALDVGCGEGADAVWLARRGWQVTALDVSTVALDRAKVAAEQVGAEVVWLHTGLAAADLRDSGFDLVSAQYPALLLADGDPVRALLRAVAPGGTLLVVHHADLDAEHMRSHGFDPDDYVKHEDVLAALDDDWRVEVAERRPRHVAVGRGAGHTTDLVLRATRLA